MKIQMLSALLAATALLCGCSTAKFTEYHGTDVFQGKGGAVRSVDDIDFWEHGDPDRKYKILGFFEASSGSRLPLGRISKVFSGSGEKDSAIAKAARKHKGDAVIIVGGARETSSEDDEEEDRGSRRHRQARKVVIVKYVE